MENLNYKHRLFKASLTGKLRIAAASTGKYVDPLFFIRFFKRKKKHGNRPGAGRGQTKTMVVESLKKNEIDLHCFGAPDK